MPLHTVDKIGKSHQPALNMILSIYLDINVYVPVKAFATCEDT